MECFGGWLYNGVVILALYIGVFIGMTIMALISINKGEREH